MNGIDRVFDTTGMLCKCGKRLVNKGHENGCYILACPNSKCGRQYQIPISLQLDYPGDYILSGWIRPIIPSDAMPKILSELEPLILGQVSKPIRKYTCRDCHREITKEQAISTFNDEGRALCILCEGREHGIEVCGFDSI